MEEGEIRKLAASAIGVSLPDSLTQISKNQSFYVFSGQAEKKGFFSFLRGRKNPLCVVDVKGIVKLNLDDAECEALPARALKDGALATVRKYAIYDESGERTPDVFLLVRGKIIDLKGMPQIHSLRH